MAQDPDGQEDGPDPGSVNPSHELDTVALYRSTTVDAQIEADIIRGLLDSQGIPTLMLRAAGYPSLGFEVRVSKANLQEAQRLIEEAKAAGPMAALEAEQASEEG